MRTGLLATTFRFVLQSNHTPTMLLQVLSLSLLLLFLGLLLAASALTRFAATPTGVSCACTICTRTGLDSFS